MKITIEQIEKLEKSIIPRLILLLIWRGVFVYFSKEAFFTTGFVIVAGIYILVVMVVNEIRQMRGNHSDDKNEEA